MDLSLREFAYKLKLSPAFVSDVELGRRYPSDKVLRNMARILGVTVDKLMEHDTRPPIEDIKRITASNPRYALAFRTVINEGISPDELMEIADRKTRNHRGGNRKKK